MKRIAILTLNGYYNYGNRLQNYATQELLKSLGFNVETIIIDRTTVSGKNLTKRLYNLRNNSTNELYYKIYNKVLRTVFKYRIRERTRVFKKFTSQYIAETDYTILIDNIPEDLSGQYDYFLTGSDQVWHPSNIYWAPIYFLTFAENEKRIAFSPSFGVNEIQPEHVDNYKKWISGMHRLSTREDDGAKIIKELTGRDAVVLVDPTMLLTRKQWLSIARKANNKPECKYLLTYFLGGIPKSYKGQIKNIAKKNNLEVINLVEIREKETYITGPNEFIDYINSCDILCTDSFHGAVFSILMEKPFIVYERIGRGLSVFSRINTLLDKFDLNSRKVENIKTNKDVFNIDYSHVLPILETERKKALDYLKEALNVNHGGKSI